MKMPTIKDTGIKYDLSRMANLRKQDIKQIIIHHTAAAVDQSAANINNFHINNRGWAGIGYHFLVRHDGTIEKGRPLTKQGVHTSGQNHNSIGVCLTGNFSTEDALKRPEQFDAAIGLVAWLLYWLNRQVPLNRHRDHNRTECPGNNFPWETLKERVYKMAKFETYKVKSGDTLGRIAKNFGTTVDAIVAANDIENPDVIFPDQVLTIPQTNSNQQLKEDLLDGLDTVISQLMDLRDKVK